MTGRLGDISLSYRHFERSKKSLSFAAEWLMCGNPKWEACHQETFGHRPFIKIDAARCSGTGVIRTEAQIFPVFSFLLQIKAPYQPLRGTFPKGEG